MTYLDLKNYLNQCDQEQLGWNVIMYDSDVDECFQLHDIRLSHDIDHIGDLVDDNCPILIK